MKLQPTKHKNEIELDKKKNHEPEEIGIAIGVVLGMFISAVDSELTGVSMFLGIAIGGLLGMLFRWFANRKD